MVREFPTMTRKAITTKQVVQKGFHLLKSIISQTARSRQEIQVQILLLIFGFHFWDSLVNRDVFRT